MPAIDTGRGTAPPGSVLHATDPAPTAPNPAPNHGPTLQRVQAAAHVAVARGKAGESRLTGLRQQGSAKILMPGARGAARPTVPEAVFLNTAGGLTGGDRLRLSAEVGAGAALDATTQTAERIYRSAGGAADLSVTLSVGEGAELAWLPQETICFDGAALTRRVSVHLGPGAAFLMAEATVLGRHAMGERVATLRFRDQWRVHQDGQLVFAEATRLEDLATTTKTATHTSTAPAGLDGAGAFATLLWVAPGAGDRLAGLRARLRGVAPVRAAASARGDVLVARFLSPDGQALRRALVSALEWIRGRAMPRVWQL